MKRFVACVIYYGALAVLVAVAGTVVTFAVYNTFAHFEIRVLRVIVITLIIVFSFVALMTWAENNK